MDSIIPLCLFALFDSHQMRCAMCPCPRQWALRHRTKSRSDAESTHGDPSLQLSPQTKKISNLIVDCLISDTRARGAIGTTRWLQSWTDPVVHGTVHPDHFEPRHFTFPVALQASPFLFFLPASHRKTFEIQICWFILTRPMFQHLELCTHTSSSCTL